MLTISKKIEYSIIIIGYFAKKQGKTISLAKAAKTLVLPYRFMGQLMVAMKEAGIVESKEGKNGGYSLAQGWDKKSVYDLMEALGENMGVVKCMVHSGQCAREEKCQIKKIWKKVEDRLVSDLKEIKLSEIN
jgi:Rrf2 family protein